MVRRSRQRRSRYKICSIRQSSTTDQRAKSAGQGAASRFRAPHRGKQCIIKPVRSRRYQVPPPAARTITALLTLRDHVIAPILAGVRSPRMGRKPAHWTRIDRDYETLRINMRTLFHDLGIITGAAAT